MKHLSYSVDILQQQTPSIAATLRQWLLQRAYLVEDTPWLSVASLEAWAIFQPAQTLEPVFSSLLCTNHHPKEQHGAQWPFVYARFAQPCRPARMLVDNF